MRKHTRNPTYKFATGESYQLAKFIEIAFGLVGLDWREDVVSDQGLCRPTDLARSNCPINNLEIWY